MQHAAIDVSCSAQLDLAAVLVKQHIIAIGDTKALPQDAATRHIVTRKKADTVPVGASAAEASSIANMLTNLVEIL